MAGLRFHLSFVCVLAIIAASRFTSADGMPWAGSHDQAVPEAPIADGPASYIEYGGEQYRLVSVVRAPMRDAEQAGVAHAGAVELAVFRLGGDEALYTTEAPGASTAAGPGGWYRWIAWPEPSAPADMRNRT